MINWIAFNKPFIFPQLKYSSENECNFSAEERTRKNEHGFSFLEAMKVHILAGQTWHVRTLHPLQNDILGGGVAVFLNILKFNYHMTMIRCALESPDLGQAFKYLGYHHITHRKFFRGT